MGVGGCDIFSGWVWVDVIFFWVGVGGCGWVWLGVGGCDIRDSADFFMYLLAPESLRKENFTFA